MKKLRYIAYIRKSEERQERQDLSHKAQIRKIKEIFPDIAIVKWMEPESKSAFKPGRPIFNEMLKMIDQGKADAIVAWHPNRLSRNEVDSAEITYRLRGNLKDLKFCTTGFENTAEGVMMLQMLMSQSQYESSKQGRDVKKGMEQKVIDKGERPGQVPLGYIKKPILDDAGRLIQLKDKILTETVPDPQRFDMVHKIWRMFLSGIYTTGEIRKIANEDWKLRSRDLRDGGGNNPIGTSSLYRILTNPFYAGIIRHNGQEYPGKHKAMISMEDFDYAQKLLGKKGRPRMNVNDYSYTGLIKCGKCGCSVVGKSRDKRLKSGKVVTYVYYHCTRKSEKRPCNQSRYTTLKQMETEINDEISKFTILPEFRDLALDIIRRNHKQEVKERNSVYKNQHKTREEIQDQLDKLLDILTRGLIQESEYTRQKNKLRDELEKIDEKIRDTEHRAKDWMKVAEKAFDFATSAKEAFSQGDSKVRRDILMTLGERISLLNQKLYIEPNEWLIPLKEQYPAIEKKYLWARTNKKAPSKELDEALECIFNTWRAIVDTIGTKLRVI